MKAGKLAGIVILIILSGCASVSVDNGDCHATYSSWFKSITEVSMSACSAKGSAAQSTVDMQDITDGVLK